MPTRSSNELTELDLAELGRQMRELAAKKEAKPKIAKVIIYEGDQYGGWEREGQVDYMVWSPEGWVVHLK